MIFIVIKLPQYINSNVSGKIEIKKLSVNNDTIISNNVINFSGVIDTNVTMLPDRDNHIDYYLPQSFNEADYSDVIFSGTSGIYSLNIGILPVGNDGGEEGIIIAMPDNEGTQEINSFMVSLMELNISFKNVTQYDETLYTEDFEYIKLYDSTDFNLGGGKPVGGGL